MVLRLVAPVMLLMLLLPCFNFRIITLTNNTCQWQNYLFGDSPELQKPHCPLEIARLKQAIYVLYDVNYPEGFNLRRDVYIRLAVFIRHLQNKEPFSNVHLVLPPWNRLYHWKSNLLLHQDNLPWSLFFDIESLKRFAPVLDFPEFLEEITKFGLQEAPYVPVHQTFQLLQFKEMFENGVFHDKYEVVTTSKDCRKEEHLHGNLLQQRILLENDFVCVRFQGSANMLENVLRNALKSNNDNPSTQYDPKIFAILNAEIVLHENWGDQEFWNARRSMRFAKPLMDIAASFRETHLNSNDERDRVQRPPMWELERPYRGAIGGPYICAHLRRGDFVHGRENTTPTLRSSAEQIKTAMHSLNLTTVFVATDASAFEFKNLKSYLQPARVIRFTTDSLEQKHKIKDGGVAIVDQLICAHARYFIGTYESTFTYRICEEREILGFQKSSTFNTFCKKATLENCSKSSVWPIVY